jgi:hypothetical protein
MPYNLTGVHDGKSQNQSFPGVGQAIDAAVANMDAGWKGVKIKCPDNTVLKEGLIRELHNAVKSGAMNA